jgi:hypothetical protein
MIYRMNTEISPAKSADLNKTRGAFFFFLLWFLFWICIVLCILQILIQSIFYIDVVILIYMLPVRLYGGETLRLVLIISLSLFIVILDSQPLFLLI